jgi:spermidine synthase
MTDKVAREDWSIRWTLYGLFALSGFAGLIYESIWSHYLKLFLGHAAYAQTLVLVIFMGGMAAGALAVARFTRRLSRPLLAYAVVEAVLGIAALTFDPLFRGVQAWFFDSVVPAIETPWAIESIKWSVAAAMIVPQSLLLGATFPLMSAGVVRLFPQGAGSVLSWLYFSNSLGASLGVLASGFVLVDLVGLPGTLLSAGLINFLLAMSVYFLSRRGCETVVSGDSVAGDISGQSALRAVLLLSAFLTGAASFMYEIGWIRMLSLVLGTTTHSFELMLSVFILGLALGSLWVRNRVDKADEPIQLLGIIQLVMAVCALLSLPLYMQLFDAMAAFWHAVRSNEGGYILYTVFSYALCVLVMLPATFCAGMTLPLLTAVLMKSGGGERSIGRIYAANTFGAIAGVLLAVHIVMPLLGLRQVVIVGAVVDGLLGLFLLAAYGRSRDRASLALPAVAAVAALGVGLATSFEPAVTGSGAYRFGKSRIEGDILFHQDGKTSTVHVASHADGTVSIATNGKIDAGMNPDGAAGPDDYTMIMLALLPLAAHPEGETAAVIGMGSGTTSHTLLYNPRMRLVDTIEIEPAMVQGARFFGEATSLVFDDPRSQIHIEDAKTFFARAGKRYDFILSEPSNPWVSGISSLFSYEFYEQAKRYLNPGGIFVQWLHLYEINPQLIASVMNALGRSFADYEIYANNGDDIMILASADGAVPPLGDWVFSEPGFAPALQRLALSGVSDFENRNIGTKATLQPFFSRLASAENSDYFPVLDQGSARQRFLIGSARELLNIHPYAQRLEGRQDVLKSPLSPVPFYQAVPSRTLHARALAARLISGQPIELDVYPDQQAAVEVLSLVAGGCDRAVSQTVLTRSLAQFVRVAANQLAPDVAAQVVEVLRFDGCPDLQTEEIRGWVDLFEGIGTDQPQLVRQAVPRIWPGINQDQAAAQFVVAELVLAELKTDGPEAAMQALGQVQGLPDNVPLSYLRAYVESRRGTLQN